MKRQTFSTFMSAALAVTVLFWGVGPGWAQSTNGNNGPKYRSGKVTTAEKTAAAARAKALGLKPGVAGLTPMAGAALTATPDPGGVPHYFGPYANWAFSPLPKGAIGSITLNSGGTGYNNPVVTVSDVFGTGSGAAAVTATATGGVITNISGGIGGGGYSAPVVIIEDNPSLCGKTAQPACGTGAAATANLDPTSLKGGISKFVDKLPGLGPTGANALGQYIPIAAAETRTFSGQDADYYEIALVEYEEKMHSDLPATRLRGYVQLSTAAVPGLRLTLINPDGSSILKPDGTPAVAVDKPHYLGPIIVATGRVHGIQPPTVLGQPPPKSAGDPKPVRIKFYNLLPTGTGGNLFLPVDESVPGSGFGPSLPGSAGDKYTHNRATIHLHGNNTVWISDGNVHQWITPKDEATPYPKGVSVRNVPDMKDATGAVECDGPNSGCMTFFYTNAQSARLQFYHDHAMGITRLNVYAGEAAGYVLTDAVDQDMITGKNETGVNPGVLKVLPDIGVPLIIQDKTFVDASTIYAQDPTWNWGTAPGTAVTGNLWYPHVYMTVQNPWDLTGTNAFGRWHYGPWFNPPVPTCVNGLPVGCIEVGPVPNEYYDPINAPWEPPMRPGNPNPSIPGESFLDTVMVNGTVYPYLEVEPKAYRFRILNAANDRFFNLQLYVAADKTKPTTALNSAGAVLCNGAVTVGNCTEVKMVPVSVAPANQYADTPSGIPDPATKGPDWILIGTEGGFMPKPVVVPSQPIGYNLDAAYFNFGIVNQHSLFLGSAERADVVVDFSAYAGKTLILYNDSPAPVPAGAVPYDFYTGMGDQTGGGGAPNVQPGYGPNTRTVMQIRVGTIVTTPTTDVTLANLEAVFAADPPTPGSDPNLNRKRGVFEVSQDPIIIPQAAYNSAYGSTYPSTAAEQYIQIAELEKTFQPINEYGGLQPAVTMPLQMKAMHDEMGGVYDTLYGRMSGMLGLSNPTSPVHVLIPYGLSSPPTDLVKGSVEGTPIGVMPDGTQIWRIFHNGVDTHTIHTHLFHTQLINRVGQDGQVSGDPVDPIEHGWKDTFRVNPLEVTYLAMRPTVPTPAQVPFDVPDSIRLIDPTLPEGATLVPPPPAGWFDPAGVNITEILNHYVNFGWEYVWHCHILSHEEMDMMHSLVFAVPPKAPDNVTATWNGNANNPRITVNWRDNSLKEEMFTIQRATDDKFTTGLTAFTAPASAGTGGTNAFTDSTVARSTKYWYRVFANGPVVGDTAAYPNSLGFPTMSADSVSTAATAITSSTLAAPAAPTNLTAALQAGPQVSLTWRDNATNEAYFAVERCTGAACASNNPSTFAQIAAPGPRSNTGNVTYVDTTVTAGNTYSYRVRAVNASGPSTTYTNTATVTVPAVPAAPTSLTVSAVKANGNNYTATLAWTAGTDPTNFTIQRAENATFTTNLASFTAVGAARGLTQNVTRNTVYYYRIRANNSISGSSAWVNALPFPIRTGN